MKCNLCGTHIFEGGESVDYEVRLAALKAAVVEAADKWHITRQRSGHTVQDEFDCNYALDAACAALATAEKNGGHP